MTYRVRRHTTSHTFKINNQICKIFLEPSEEYLPGFWLWNVGFAIGKSKRQINDWYWRKNNKRRRSLATQLTGKQGIKAIKEGFDTVLRLRWKLEPGDCLKIDCTSINPGKQFRAFSRWHRYHPEWTIDFNELIFYWHRPPVSNDLIWDSFRIFKITPDNQLANTADLNYFNCFRAFPKKINANAETNINLLLNSFINH